uniref:Ribosome biogenesis protein NOP53 n=1 Tax=Mesocestoides corti TaxID=53468 RepID=A0A5K3F3I6_MESCO
MKNRGKNKKKQWRHILKNLGSELSDVAKEKALSSGGFVIQKKNKAAIVKGDKEAAKDHPELPTASTATKKKVYRPGKASVVFRALDVWADDSKEGFPDAAPHPASKPDSIEPICPAGQSYNPSAVDHQVLLLHVAKEELKKEAAENPQSAKRLKPRKKLAVKRNRPQTGLVAKPMKAKAKDRNPNSKDLAKKMQNDLENIPKILKEIKKEKRELAERRQKRELQAAIRKHEKSAKFPISFQLPGELASSLRKLRTDENWMREVEFKRNKLPRARKTLGTKVATKTFVRRSRDS